MTDADARAFIATVAWHTAKSADEPHQWTSWYELDGPGRERFEWFRSYVREHGYAERFGKRTYRYLELDGCRYWAMFRFINRARLGADVATAKAARQRRLEEGSV